jgi:hypothetical protein
LPRSRRSSHFRNWKIHGPVSLWKYCLICDSVLRLYMLLTTLCPFYIRQRWWNREVTVEKHQVRTTFHERAAADTTRRNSTEQTVFSLNNPISPSPPSPMTSKYNTVEAVQAYVDLQTTEQTTIECTLLSGTKAFRLDNDHSRLIWFSTTRCP